MNTISKYSIIEYSLLNSKVLYRLLVSKLEYKLKDAARYTTKYIEICSEVGKSFCMIIIF